jgi:hypothetical protein
MDKKNVLKKKKPNISSFKISLFKHGLKILNIAFHVSVFTPNFLKNVIRING